MNKLSTLSFAAFLLLFVSCEPVADVREPFLGTYSVHETCDVDGAFTYNMNIVRQGGAGNEVEIEGVSFYNLPFQPNALVSGGRIDIPIQKYYVRQPPAGPEISYEFSGTGNLVDSVLTIHYNVTRYEDTPLGLDIRNLDDCTMVCTKQ